MLKFTRAFVAILWMGVFAPQTVVASNEDIDVITYSLHFDARGVLTTGINAQANLQIKKTDSLTSINLSLLGFTVDSIFVHNNLTTFSRVDETLSINVPVDDTIEVSIFYHGIGQTDGNWGGFHLSGQYAYNMGVSLTNTPHTFGRAWFPCNDNFTDRALYTVETTTASGFMAVCGGLLTHDTTYFDGSRKTTWQLNQPIPTYLASIAIGKYTIVKHTFTGQFGNIPVWLAAEAKDTTNLKLSFVRINTAIQCFEDKFGPYLFDRVGFVGVPHTSGAMEHAANIAYPIYAINGNTNYETLMAHELSHHWWGNLATCRTASDMWLNEGWASFCEALFLECAYNTTSYQKDLRTKLTDVLVNAPKNDDGYVSVGNASDENTYGTHVYQKGALMVNVLRHIIGDSAFFVACKAYLNQYRFADVSTNDLKATFQQHTSTDLTPYFNNYILTKGHYDVIVHSWELNGTTLTVNLNETNRYKAAANTSMQLNTAIYFTDGTKQIAAVNISNSKGTFTTTIPATKTISHFVVDEEINYALAYNIDSLRATTKGVKNLPNTMLSLNVQTVGDSAAINVQHHWVGATGGNIRNKGIRISTDRYWSIRGKIPANFSAYTYFNYDGSTNAELDKGLLDLVELEDSLVLLHRANENQEWQVITTGITFQPGGNIDDKLGRFWLTKLIAGDYAFGLRDETVIGVHDITNDKSLAIFPNPTTDKITLSLPNKTLNKNTTIKLTTTSGVTVETPDWQTSKTGIVLNTKSLKAGYYIITVTHENNTYSAKFLKQ